MGRFYKKSRQLALIVAAAVSLCAFSGCSSSKSSVDDESSVSYAESENRIDDKNGICYQVFLYSFCDSDGDGIGDIQGLISKLDYIQELGVSSMWLLPFNESTTYHKYDVVDYYTIDEDYGTMEDFEQLVEECKERNIDIYMDYVINHTSSENEWFKEATAYIKTLGENEEPDYTVCPYAEYYNFKRSSSAISGWSKVSGTKDWYYECVFWDKMPDINLDCEAARTEIEEIASFWIDKGISGFRLDAALHYYEASHGRSTEALGWFCDYVESIDPSIYCVAEVWDSYSTIQEFYESGIDSLFNFVYGNSDGLIVKTINRNGNGKAGASLAKNIVEMYETFSEINPDYVDGVFLDNHDTGRAAGFLSRNEEKMKLAAGIQMMSTGCVFVYYGSELGMTGSGIDENKRAPMYWTDDADSADMTVGPPNMEKQEQPFGSLETQEEDESSIYNYYRKAIHLRNKYPEIGRGVPAVMEEVTEQDGNLCALSKTYEDSTLYVIINDNTEAATVTVSQDSYDYTELADYLVTGEETPALDGDKLTIPAFGIVVLK